MNECECELQEIREKIQAVNPIFSDELLNLICEYVQTYCLVWLEKIFTKSQDEVDDNGVELTNWD